MYVYIYIYICIMRIRYDIKDPLRGGEGQPRGRRGWQGDHYN